MSKYIDFGHLNPYMSGPLLDHVLGQVFPDYSPADGFRRDGMRAYKDVGFKIPLQSVRANPRDPVLNLYFSLDGDRVEKRTIRANSGGFDASQIEAAFQELKALAP